MGRSDNVSFGICGIINQHSIRFFILEYAIVKRI